MDTIAIERKYRALPSMPAYFMEMKWFDRLRIWEDFLNLGPDVHHVLKRIAQVPSTGAEDIAQCKEYAPGLFELLEEVYGPICLPNCYKPI